LHEAALDRVGGVDKIKKALGDPSINININDLSRLKKTALHYAASCGNESVVSFLLRKGADINKLDSYNQSALHEAVVSWNGDKTIVETLLKGGAPVNLQDHNGETALHLACRNGNDTIIKKLLRKADVSLMNSRQEITLRLVGENQDAAKQLLLRASYR
jgi:ankyrin repeat protein